MTKYYVSYVQYNLSEIGELKDYETRKDVDEPIMANSPAEAAQKFYETMAKTKDYVKVFIYDSKEKFLMCRKFVGVFY